jgi:hypothetical protein
MRFAVEKYEKYPRPAFENRNHYHHFVDACLGQATTESHFAQTGPMTEAIYQSNPAFSSLPIEPTATPTSVSAQDS